MRAMSEQPALLQEIRKKINQRLENSKTRQVPTRSNSKVILL